MLRSVSRKWCNNLKVKGKLYRVYTTVIRLIIFNGKDFETHIQRIADGATILPGKPITTISLSSGTTHEKPKFVPLNDELRESTMQIYLTSFAFTNSTRKTKEINAGLLLLMEKP